MGDIYHVTVLSLYLLYEMINDADAVILPDGCSEAVTVAQCAIIEKLYSNWLGEQMLFQPIIEYSVFRR